MLRTLGGAISIALVACHSPDLSSVVGDVTSGKQLAVRSTTIDEVTIRIEQLRIHHRGNARSERQAEQNQHTRLLRPRQGDLSSLPNRRLASRSGSPGGGLRPT